MQTFVRRARLHLELIPTLWIVPPIRLLAALGLLDDAAPLFAPTRNLPRAGVLLAIPALMASDLAFERDHGQSLNKPISDSENGCRTQLLAETLSPSATITCKPGWPIAVSA